MSDAPISDGVEADAGPEVGEAGEAEQFEAVSEEPARQYLEVEDPDNRWVRTKVDGEEIEVPYSEFQRGYSRESDYTRKTQALAEQRREAEFGIRLQQALNANPRMTLQLLAEQHGLSLAEARAAQAAAEPEMDFADPLEKMVHEERSARLALEQRLAQREVDEQLERTVQGLRTEFNANDEDVRAAITTAMQMNVGVEMLPMIYKTIAYDRFQATLAAHRAQQAAQEAATQQRTQAKAQASQIVSAGRGAGNGLTDRLNTDRNMSIREALESAWDQVEG
jgi:hypothetical protein